MTPSKVLAHRKDTHANVKWETGITRPLSPVARVCETYTLAYEPAYELESKIIHSWRLVVVWDYTSISVSHGRLRYANPVPLDRHAAVASQLQENFARAKID